MQRFVWIQNSGLDSATNVLSLKLLYYHIIQQYHICICNALEITKRSDHPACPPYVSNFSAVTFNSN